MTLAAALQGFRSTQIAQLGCSGGCRPSALQSPADRPPAARGVKTGEVRPAQVAVANVTEGQVRDRRRDNRHTKTARPSLRDGWHEVSGEPCGVATEVAEALIGRGWAGYPGHLLALRANRRLTPSNLNWITQHHGDDDVGYQRPRGSSDGRR